MDVPLGVLSVTGIPGGSQQLVVTESDSDVDLDSYLSKKLGSLYISGRPIESNLKFIGPNTAAKKAAKKKQIFIHYYDSKSFLINVCS